MKVSPEGIALIKHFEGCKLKAYKCPAEILTIGYGHTGSDVKSGMVITQVQADALLLKDLAQFEKDVSRLVKVPIMQRHFDALVSFAFNVGSDIDDDTLAEGLGDSSLLRFLNQREYTKAAAEFLKWVNAGGKKLDGLVKRRRAEHIMFLGGDWRMAIK
jgi:lysozyme